jgi:hypothetical protein
MEQSTAFIYHTNIEGLAASQKAFAEEANTLGD